MISNSVFKKIINFKNHFPKLDNRGALLIPTTLKLKDLEFMKYRHLPVNWQINAVTEDDSESEHIDENEIIRRCDELYGSLLLKYIGNHHLNIKLNKRELC